MTNQDIRKHILTNKYDLEAACSYVVEMLDNQTQLQKAFDMLSRMFSSKELVKFRLAHHASVSGYDNSEELVANLR